MNDFWQDGRAARSKSQTHAARNRKWRAIAGKIGWLGTAAGLLAGCNLAKNVQHRTADEVRAAALAHVGGAPDQAARIPTTEAETLEGLLAGVILSDHQCRMAVADLRLAGVQLDEAYRQPLPRLVAQGSLQMPITSGHVDTVFSGGLFLQFDLIRAFFYRNSVTVAELVQEAGREKCRSSATAACNGFFNSVIQLETLKRSTARNQSARQLATQAATEAEALFKAGQLGADRWQLWEQRRAEMNLEQERLAARRQQARADLNQRYDSSVDDSVLLRHTEAFLQRLANNGTNPSPPSVDALLDTLENTPGVVSAKLDLFLAEMNVIDARLKRLPSISVGLGYGQIPVQGNEWKKETGIIPMMEISMPILDMGDNAREVKRARLRAGESRERMIQAVETSRQTLESTRQKLTVAESTRATETSLRDAAAARRDELTTLRNAGRATVMDVHEAGWTLIQAETEADQAEQDYRQALLAERAARGVLLDGPLQKVVFAKLNSENKTR